MIQMLTKLDVADNSGAKLVECIKVIGGSKKEFASVGDVIIVAVKEATTGGKAKKGEVKSAVVVRTKFPIMREDGSYIQFDTNSVVLINKESLDKNASSSLNFDIKSTLPDSQIPQKGIMSIELGFLWRLE